MRTAIFGFLLLLPLFSCSSTKENSNSPELGGPGFEDIASKDGWKSGNLSNEELRYIADTHARKGGEIRLAVSDYPPTFRIYGKDANTQTSRILEDLIYESLIKINPLTLELMPGLATHWRVDDDGVTYWFRLDPRARFADGASITTEDVIATYRLAVDPGILDPYINQFYEQYDPPEAISPYIFKIRSK